MVLWPVLRGVALAARGFDLVERPVPGFFTALMLNTQRFTGTWSVVAAPYLGRDLDAWIAARALARRGRVSAWARAGSRRSPVSRSASPEWLRIEYPLGVRLDMARYPVRACDFMAAHGVRGRGFNDFQGGYQAWRFWPDRERLPFMTGTPEAATKTDRNLLALRSRSAPVARAGRDPSLRLRAHQPLSLGLGTAARLPRRRFRPGRWCSPTMPPPSTCARGGPLARVAADYGYRLPARAAPSGWEPSGQQAALDTTVRSRAARRRSCCARRANRPTTSQAYSLLARAAFTRAAPGGGAALYHGRAIAAERRSCPASTSAWGWIALAEATRGRRAGGVPARERRLLTTDAGLDVCFGWSYAALGDAGRAMAPPRGCAS